MAVRYKPQINHNSEFELDLAPLLAVMVKLVPVLLVSSAFVQMMIIETELPQVVKEAIVKQENNTKSTLISLSIDKKSGVSITVNENGKSKVTQVDLIQNKDIDFEKVHLAIVEIKKSYPEVFKIEFNPSADIAYKDIVKLMDEVRKSKSIDTKFPVKDEKTCTITSTDFIFPEVTFANILEG